MTAAVNVIIQARFSSARLPGKALYPLGGIPVIAFLIRRLKSGLAAPDFRIILATSTSPQDDIIAAWGLKEEVAVVRGSLENVLSRYMQVLESFPARFNVRVTGDNPLTCPNVLDACVRLMAEKKHEYVISRNFPYGTGVDVFTNDLLRQTTLNIRDSRGREHINIYALEHPNQVKTGYLDAFEPYNRPDLRMTLDTDEDYKRLCSILDSSDKASSWTLSLKEAIDRLDAHSL